MSAPSIYLPGASFSLYEALPSDKVDLGESPVLLTKSKKNEVHEIPNSGKPWGTSIFFSKAEVAGMINSHLRDAYACCRFFAELEDDIVNNGNSKEWTELDVAQRQGGELAQRQSL